MADISNFFKDKDGKVVIWQTPNLPLSTWIVATILTKVFSDGKPHSLFEVLAFAAIAAWSYMELRSGSSPFRRVLGAVVLVLSIYSRVQK